MKRVLLCGLLALTAALPVRGETTRSTRELTEVALNMGRQPRVKWSNYRFISFGGLRNPDEQKVAIRGMLATMNTTANGLDKIITELSPMVWGIDTTKVDWPANAWEEMSKEWVYYTSVPTPIKDYLKAKTGSEFPVMRADVFIADGWNSRWYPQFLKLPKTKAEMLDKLKIDLSKPLGVGVVSEKLTVTHHPGKVARYETPDKKRVWVRMNYVNARGKNNSRENPHNLDCNYNEFTFELPNGLDAFAAYDAETGRLSKFSDTRVSVDRHGQAVELGQSCFQCHDKGPKLLDHIDDVSVLNLTSNRLVYDKDWVAATAKLDKKSWLTAFKKVTGVEAEVMSKANTKVNHNFTSSLTFKQVANEIGVSEESLKDKLKGSGKKDLVSFSDGDKEWTRDKLESHYPAILRLYRSDDEAYIKRYIR